MASYRFNVGVGWVVVGIDVDVDVGTDAASVAGWTTEEVELDMTDWISGRMVVIRGGRHHGTARTDDQHHPRIKVSRCMV